MAVKPLVLSAAFSLIGLFSVPGHAQPAYPNKPITAVVPLPAGGAADSLARAWADYMTKALGQPVVIDNRAGANGSVAASYVARQPANGYTFLFGSTSNMSLNPFSYKTLTYDPVKDFDPVLMLAGTAQVLVTSSATGIKNFDDLVKKARATPGSLNFGSAGKGNSTHLNVEFVAQHYKLQMTHVPYRGAAPAMVGLLGGETQITADALTSVVPQVRTGKIVPLLVFSDKRSAALPDVPTVYEVGMKDFPAGGWYGLMAPKGTPKEVIARLNEETNKFWADPAMKARMQALFMEPPTAPGPDAVAKTMRDEATVWGPIIQRLGVQND
ncbi:Bug family tripartite tricarboxylate transporter substrate binding protein [Variovorax sp. LT1R16]|uniref:Bug family tripartite tricarboxylate transporter substrate binding protein n=1 Tax=Variovorax sp. LT1R16 TaxID=3443728 RepID=UPI003F476665